MTPQEIHDLGLAQMDKIQTEMRQIGERSFNTADPIALLKLVKTDPKYRFKSRDELIKYAEAAVERAQGRRCRKPSAGLPAAPVIVEPYPAYLEKTAPGGQAVPPTADGKPGKYLINAYKATEQSRAGLESTAFHEAYPGHHLQARGRARAQGAASDLALFLPLRIRRRLGALHRAAGRRDGSVLVRRRSARPALERSASRRAARRRLGHARARMDAPAGDRLRAVAHDRDAGPARRPRSIATSPCPARRRRT